MSINQKNSECKTQSWGAIEPDIRARYPGDPELIRVALETGSAFIYRRPTGFAVLSIHTTDYGIKELYVWTVIGQDCGQYTDDLRAVAKEHGCVRCTVRVERPGLVKLMHKHGWQTKSVELAVEV